MIIYEITAKVRLDLCSKYEAYMRETHIPDLLKTGAFTGATISTAEPGAYRISYQVQNREDLDRYVRDHAPALRADVAKHFPEGVEQTRIEWTVLEQW